MQRSIFINAKKFQHMLKVRDIFRNITFQLCQGIQNKRETLSEMKSLDRVGGTMKSSTCTSFAVDKQPNLNLKL